MSASRTDAMPFSRLDGGQRSGRVY